MAVVEYGTRNAELLAGLAARGVDVVRVPVYRWALPEDREPLREVSRLARGEADYVLFTSGRQLGLREAVLGAAQRTVVGSIGPLCSEALRRHKLPVDLEPEHPKMGHLVVAIARSRGGGLETAPLNRGQVRMRRSGLPPLHQRVFQDDRRCASRLRRTAPR